jgi:hypothetical protein
MLGSRARRYFALVLSIVVGIGCGDYSQSTSPPPARKLVSPTSANYSRYILISGVWTLVEDDDGGDGGGTARADTGGDMTGGMPIDELLPGPAILPDSAAP